MARSAGECSYDTENAWVTMITNDDYLDGVIVLAYSLLRAGSKYRILVSLTPGVTDDARCRLARLDNCRTVDVEAIAPPPGSKTNYAFPHFAESWTKLAVWNMEEYNRLVWLDADMLVLRNMDELFDIEMGASSIAAAPQCLCNGLRFDSFPDYFKVENCPYRGTSQQKRLFNAGLLVATPSARVYNELMHSLHELDLGQMHFAEQDLLNGYFADRWHVLDYSYNATKGISRAHPEMWDLNIVKNVHYAGVGAKPWDFDMKTAEVAGDPSYHINKPWWDIHREAYACIYSDSAATALSASSETSPS